MQNKFYLGLDKYDRELACLRIQTTLGQIDVVF